MASRRTETSVTLSPPDNRALANLCGPLDVNLRQIEAACDVAITHRGDRFTIAGAPDRAAQAKSALERFYATAEKPLSVDDIQLGLVEIATRGPRPVAEDGDLPALRTRRADLHGRTPNQIAYLNAIQSHDITFGIGPAGTGKTYLAVACAVDAIERDTVKRLVLVRPAVEAGEKLGFLPGDLQDKVDPYLRPLYDALYDLLDFEDVSRLEETGVIEVAPLAFMRGRTLNDAFVILDEAQNTTSEQMKMFLTRLGYESKAVVTGDVTQTDLPADKVSGLVEALSLLRDVEGIGFMEFSERDVVRHPLVQAIIRAYERRRTGGGDAGGAPPAEPAGA